MLSIPENEGQVNLSVYDLSGRCVDTVASGVFKAGEHSVVWDPSQSSISTGVYFLRMDAPGTVVTEKLVIIR
jgi:flagellar hook assembly protein FlgD